VAAAAAGPDRPGSLTARPSLRPCRGSERGKAPVAVAATTSGGGKAAAAAAADVVRAFYDGVNRRDLAAVEPLIAEGCVYEDLVFPRPFVGRERIIGFFGEFMGTISADLQFVIDDISAEDSAAVGVTWHLGTRAAPTPPPATGDPVVGVVAYSCHLPCNAEWRGRPFPFSRGCSFYRLVESEDQQPQIV
jgi:ketosteroid isomerase-like protein